jgi:serine/threonine-protein kinase
MTQPRIEGPAPHDTLPGTDESPAGRWLHRWREGTAHDVRAFLAEIGPLAPEHVVAVLLVEQRQRWQAGERVTAETYLRDFPELHAQTEAVVELIYGEFLLREHLGDAPSAAEYRARFSVYADWLDRQFALHAALGTDTAEALDASSAVAPTEPDVVRHPAGRPACPPRGGGGPLPELPGYEILERLGAGGMGVVYRAWQVRPGRLVALKMITPEGSANPQEAAARFLTEAEAVGRLQHPNIVPIYEMGEHAGRPYFSMELVEGGGLDRHIAGTPQPARESAALVQILATAMHAVHLQGIVHRDLKPANILLQRGEERGARDEESTGSSSPLVPRPSPLVPKITDFGLAKLLVGGPQLTQTQAVLGTPSYMAPEQAVGGARAVGPATDVYALGAILYECLTGRPPFKAATAVETLAQVLDHDPLPVRTLQPEVPRALEAICLKCLHKKPAGRYGTALELAEDLRRFLRDEPTRARSMTPIGKLWRWTRRQPVSAGLLAAGLLAPLVALVTLSLLSARLVRSSALESAMQQAELLEEANNEYSRIVQRVEQADFPVNKMVPPTPGTVPLSIPATFLHDVGEQLRQGSRTGVQVRQYSDYPFPWREQEGGARDEFEREALRRLRDNKGQEPVYEFTEMDGQRVVRYAQARIMKRSCIDCHNTHPYSKRKDWKEGDVRGVLEIIRPLDKDEARVGEALRLALLLSAAVSILLLAGSLLVLWVGRRPRSGA